MFAVYFLLIMFFNALLANINLRNILRASLCADCFGPSLTSSIHILITIHTKFLE